MPKNKQSGKQPEKDNQNIPSDQRAINEAQIQEQLAHYEDIAQQLYASKTYQQAEEAISPINEMAEEDQLTFLNALSRERNTDSASVLLAINMLTQHKQVRKEARRALIRLESMNTYSQWTPPPMPSLLESLNSMTVVPSDEAESSSGPDFLSAGSDFDPFGDIEDDDEEGEDDEDDTVIDEFIEAWAEQSYAEAYELLSADSPLRGGLDKSAWVALREEWAEQAQPEAVKVEVGYRYETDEELENTPETDDETTQELDAFWSLTYQETPLDSSLPELPKATITYPVTGRHWFWASYTLTKNAEDEWSLHHLTDRGTEAQQLSDDELNQRIEEISSELKEMPIFEMFSALENPADEDENEDENESEEEVDEDLLDDDDDELLDEDAEEDDDEEDTPSIEEQFEEAYWFTLQASHYTDALIAHNPHELNYYERALAQAESAQDDERIAAYFPLIAQNIPEERGLALRAHAAISLKRLKDMIESDMDEETINAQTELIEQIMRESLTINIEATDYIALAQLLVEQGERLDEAEQLYQQALAVAGDSETRATIEIGLADVAHTREKPEEALIHLQRASDLAPTMQNIWYKLGDIYQDLGQTHRAEESYIRSTEVDPENEDAFAALATLWGEQGKKKEVMQIIEKGLDANPDSVTLRGLLAIQYIDQHNYKKAEQLLEEAEELDPDSEIIQLARQVLSVIQIQSQQGKPKSNKRKKR